MIDPTGSGQPKVLRGSGVDAVLNCCDNGDGAAGTTTVIFKDNVDGNGNYNHQPFTLIVAC